MTDKQHEQKKALVRYLDSYSKQIESVLPDVARAYLTPERIVKIVVAAASRSPRLLECDGKTILRSVMDIVACGLEPGGPLQQAHLVPFKNGRTGRMECQPIIDFKGYVELAHRTGRVLSVDVDIIHENDKYRVIRGTDARIEHEPCLEGDPGKPIGAYVVLRLKDGGHQSTFMTRHDINKIRHRSKAAEKGPWMSDWEEMAKKTVIRRARKLWPQSIEIAQAAAVDDRFDAGELVSDRPLVTDDEKDVPGDPHVEYDYGPPEWGSEEDQNQAGGE